MPIETFDFVQIEKSYYLGADKGGDKAYQLLSESMDRKGRVAVGRWAARGKEQLVILRPYRDGLILHQLFYSNEVRDFAAVDEDRATFQFSDKERDLAEKLIEQLSSDEMVPEKYEDDYANRVRGLVEQKVAGQEITISQEQPKAQIIDLFEALKKSLTEAKEKSTTEDAPAKEDETAAPVKKATARRTKKKKTG